MCVEHGLVLYQSRFDRFELGICGMVRIGHRRQASELHKTGHKQQPRFCSRQVAAGNAKVGGARRLGEPFCVAPSHPDHGHADENGAF